VLRPKSIPEGDNMSDYEEAIRKAVAYDEVCKLLKQPTTTSKEETIKKLSEIISDKERYLRERNEARIERDNYAEEIKAKDVQIALLKKDIQALNNDLEECQSQVPEDEDLEKDYEATGKKIIKTVGDTVIETSYKKKG
jgi:chromosome segregation ATPase